MRDLDMSGVPAGPPAYRQRIAENRLDERRVKTALSRVRAAQQDVQYHENAAKVARAKIDVLIRTWDLCAVKNVESDMCCQRPEDCSGPLPF